MPAWPTFGTDVNGLGVSYLRTGGDKPPIVLLHGLMGSGEAWTPVAQTLSGELDVVMPDARGHGRSGDPGTGYRYQELAADVAGLVEELGLSRPVLVGHSMGGMTAAVAATLLGRQIRGLILVDPTFLSSTFQREVYESDVAEQHRRAIQLERSALLDQTLARLTHRPRELVKLQVDARLSTRLAAFDILRPPNPPYRELVSALEVPTLIVIGDRPVLTLDIATELCALNPRVRVEQIDNAGHGLPFDQPEKLAQAVLAFLRELPSAV